MSGAAKRIANCGPSKETERDWGTESLANAGLLKSTKEPPSERDYREDWWTVFDQEDTGACVGCAASDGILRWHFVKLNRLSKDVLLSCRFIWMAAKETDGYIDTPTTFIETAPTTIKQALEIAKKYGCVTEDMLPFKSGKLYSGTSEDFFVKANTFRIASYVALRTLDQWRDWIAFEGPIISRLNVDENWYKLQEDHSGKLDRYNFSGENGHAVTIVGYTADRFIIRNSYGADWGDKGFAYASKQYVMEAFKTRTSSHPEWLEAYGIKVY